MREAMWQEVRAVLSRRFAREARLERDGRFIRRVSLVTFMLLILGFYVAAPLIVSSIRSDGFEIPDDGEVGEYLGLSFVVWGGLIVAANLESFIRDSMDRLGYRVSLGYLLVILSLALLAAFLLVARRDSAWSEESDVSFGLLSALLYTNLLLLVVWSLVFIGAVVTYLTRRYRVAINPGTYVVAAMAGMLVDSSKATPQWLNPGSKSAVCAALEDLAQCVEWELPKSLDAADGETNAWVRQQLSYVAAQIRQTKRDVLTSADAHKFQRWALDTLSTMLQARWLDLPALEVVKERVPWHTRALQAVFLFLPLVLLLVLLLYPPDAAGPILDTLEIALGIWTVVGFVKTFDPYFESKVSAVKETLSSGLIPGIK